MKARRTFLMVGLMAILAAAMLPLQVCRDWAFIDRNTGSRKGYREWLPGWRSGSWYQESAIEAFMRSRHPAEFQQDWVSYAGTGRTIFGGAVLYGHGRPGRILVLKPEQIDNYCRTASESEKRRLYDVFASGEEATIRELVDEISGAAGAGHSSLVLEIEQQIAEMVRVNREWEMSQFRSYRQTDIDGDCVEDAILLTTFEHGMMWRRELFVCLSSSPQRVMHVNLGSKGERMAEEFDVKDGMIVVEGKAYADSDAMCCPSRPYESVYVVANGKIAERYYDQRFSQ